MKHPFKRSINGMMSAVAILATLLGSATMAQSPQAEKQRFLRFVEGDDVCQLQTSIVRYENDAGVQVDLIGAVHIGDAEYFKDLNTRFKRYDALLYEMVKPKGADTAAITRASGTSRSWVSMLQRFMKDQLELDFQLDLIDYGAANFVHADLDAETFVRRQEERGESMLRIMLDSMLRELSKPAGERAGAQSPMGILDLIEALQAPDRGRQLKLVLGRQFSDIDDALAALGGPDGSVILDERNQHALDVLDQEIKAGKKNLAIFYGAGHLKGMDKIMTQKMGFKAVGEPEWVVAWDIPMKPHARSAPIAPASEPTTQPAHRTAPDPAAEPALVP